MNEKFRTIYLKYIFFVSLYGHIRSI